LFNESPICFFYPLHGNRQGTSKHAAKIERVMGTKKYFENFFPEIKKKIRVFYVALKKSIYLHRDILF